VRNREEAEPRHSSHFLSARPVSLCTRKRGFQEKEDRRMDEAPSNE